MHRYSKRAKERKKKQKKTFFKWLMCVILLPFFVEAVFVLLLLLVRWFVDSDSSIHLSIHEHTLVYLLFIPFRKSFRCVCVTHRFESLYGCEWEAYIHRWTRSIGTLSTFTFRTSVYFTFGYLSSYTFRTHHHTTRIYVCVLRMAKTHKFLSIFYHSI